jgi:hypothetical protein
VHFPSLEAMVATERDCVRTLGGLLDDDRFDGLLAQARRRLQAFVQDDGSVRHAVAADHGPGLRRPAPRRPARGAQSSFSRTNSMKL